jgi:hypothetical protein
MKSILLGGVAFVYLSLCLISGVLANGSLFGHGSDDEVLTEVLLGTSGVVTAIADSNRVLGYSVTGSANAIVGIYDNSGIITEGGCLANDMQTVWFPFPKEIDTELIVMVNAGTTIVTIFYE